MRTYLVIIDETEEAVVALRFAARRAAKTRGAVEILSIIPRQEFVAWGAVQATIEQEARKHAEDVVSQAVELIADESGLKPVINVKQGATISLIREAIAENPDIAAIVLGAARTGAPGPLVSYFAGADAGSLPCPVMIVPGALTPEELDRLS
jgi:nucleotide-binding universal stress UspA family protein